MIKIKPIRYLLSCAFFIGTVTSVTLQAQEEAPRPVTSAFRVEIGGVRARSTYLSPLPYTGTDYGISAAWDKAFNRHPENIVMSFEAAGWYQTILNPARSARMMGADVRFDWGLAFRKRMSHNLQFTAGGMVEIDGGALYLMRNGNNPVSVNASAGIGADCSLSWHFTIGGLPILISDRVKMPFIGAFFAPEYGETYYEIYLGNHKNLCHCGWWGNNFGIDNLLSIKLDFGRTAMEIGYRYDYRSSFANRLVTRTSTNNFVIGVIPGGLGLKKKSRINSALY